MIVRNEEKNLRACLASLSSMMHEMIVVDTGSTDQTKSLALELGAKVFDFPWCEDFSAARNEGLKHATGDWIFWLDADDRLDDVNMGRLTRLLDTLSSEPRGYMMSCILKPAQVEDSDIIIPHCRLFPNHPEARWQRRVHEQIVPSLERVGMSLEYTGIEIVHVGYHDPALKRRKANRNIRLLKLEFATNPEDPFTLFNLGAAYSDIGQRNEALGYLLSAIKHLNRRQTKGQFGDLQRCLYAMTSDLLARQSRREEAVAVLDQGLTLYPDDIEMLTRKGQRLAELNDAGGAERAFQQVLRLAGKARPHPGHRNVQDGSEARLSLGRLCAIQGRSEEAEKHYQEHLAQRPFDIGAWYFLGHESLRRGRWAEAENTARQIEKCPGGRPYAQVFRVEALQMRGDFARAKELLDQILGEEPRWPWAHRVLGNLLAQTGASVEEQIAIEKNILRIDPGNVIAEANLHRLRAATKPPTPVNPAWFSFQI
jgi:tetratricopeptide (TPR) repeat protein